MQGGKQRLTENNYKGRETLRRHCFDHCEWYPKQFAFLETLAERKTNRGFAPASANYVRFNNNKIILLLDEKLCARHFLTADAVPKKCCFARDSGRPLCFAFRLLRRTTFASRPNIMQNKKVTVKVTFYFGDPDENRTRVTAVKGRCLNRLTTGPYSLSLLGKGFVSW